MLHGRNRKQLACHHARQRFVSEHDNRGIPTWCSPRCFNLVWTERVNLTATPDFCTATMPGSVHSHNDEDGVVVLEVADNGVGPSAEALPKIFDPYEQGDPDRTRQFKQISVETTPGFRAN